MSLLWHSAINKLVKPSKTIIKLRIRRPKQSKWSQVNPNLFGTNKLNFLQNLHLFPWWAVVTLKYLEQGLIKISFR
jgi:hypothetical protein